MVALRAVRRRGKEVPVAVTQQQKLVVPVEDNIQSKSPRRRRMRTNDPGLLDDEEKEEAVVWTQCGEIPITKAIELVEDDG